MFLAIIILILAGLYTCIKREVRVSSKFIIRGRAAEHIGLALLMGGIATVGLPALCHALGLFRDFVASILLTILTAFAALVYVAFIAFAEKRRLAAQPAPPPAPGKTP